MLNLGKAEQFAIGAVARHFSSDWQPGEAPPVAYLSVSARRVALDLAVMAQRAPRPKAVDKARLREDKVAQRVLRGIDAALRMSVPDDKAMILTLGAPIKVPKQFVSALTDMLQAYLEGGAEEVDEKETVLGNRVRFRVVNHRSQWHANVIGFVFTGDPEPGVLANAVRSLHEEIVAIANQRLPKGSAGERWLVLESDHWIADIKTYRRIYALTGPAHNFRKILMVYDGGRVEVLVES